MLSVVMLSVAMLSLAMLSVAMLRKTKSCLLSLQWIPKTTGKDLVNRNIGGDKIVSSVNKTRFQNSHQRKESH